MSFLQQIKVEMKNILRSKFLLIIGILLLVASIGIPVINATSNNNNPNYIPGIPMQVDVAYEKSMYMGDYYGGEYEESITVDGVTITGENPFFWNIRSLLDEKDHLPMSDIFSEPAVLDLTLELIDTQITHYVRLAQFITTHEDYRSDLAWRADMYVTEIFIYDHIETDKEILFEAIQFRVGYDETMFKEKFVDISAEERLKAQNEAEDKLTTLYETIEKNDFPAFVQLSIAQEIEQVDEFKEQIALHEQSIIDSPQQEEHLSMIIEDLQKSITNIEENRIPIWEYRLENNIVPRDGSWQNSALNDIEQYQSEIMYTQILSEEEFNKESYMAMEYGSYAKYKQEMQARIDNANNNILIAQNSLDADKPDMKFVRDGTRAQTMGFLDFSIYVAMFGVLVGGWFIAREFSQGTIRLLMIRPKTRIKIIMSKFLAALIVCLGLYTAGCLINIVANGMFVGFADFSNPNFTVSGQIGFFGYYFPKFLACSVSIIFGLSVAFMLSTVTKNIAVSIAVPFVCYIGSVIGMGVLAYSRMLAWIAYTPIPYVQFSSFFSEWSPVNRLIERGMPISMTYGIILLLVLSAVCTFISVWVFKKRDITN